MPTVTVQGLRVDSVQIQRNDSDGELKFEGRYSIMLSNGKVLSKPTFNGYGSDVKIEQSAEIKNALTALLSVISKEILALAGLIE